MYFFHRHSSKCSPYVKASQGQGIWTLLTRRPSRSTTIGACAMAARFWKVEVLAGEAAGTWWSLLPVRCSQLAKPIRFVLPATVVTIVCSGCLLPQVPPTLSGTFEPVDGGVGRVCRGAHENDNLAHYFDVQSVSWLSALTECGWSKSLFASRLAEMHEGVLGPRLCNPCLTHLTLRRLH